MDDYPGLIRDVQTYLKERIREVLAGSSHPIVIRIFGPDLEVLRSKAKEINTALADDPGHRRPPRSRPRPRSPRSRSRSTWPRPSGTG